MSLGQVLRGMFFQLDAIIYGLVSKIYYLFYLLTETTFFRKETIQSFSSRIYILISIIMAFKLAFSFINYIVSPDTITDKQKGGGKLVKNIVVSVVLLAAVPTIFDEAYYLQGIIIKENIIPNLILGSESSIADLNNVDEKERMATELATYTFLTFVGPNQRLSVCQNSSGLQIEEECIKFLNDNSLSKNLGNDYKKSIENRDFNNIISSSSRDSQYVEMTGENEGYSDKHIFLLDYQWGISSIAGLYLCFILLGFCLDVSIRIIKLGFLQLIAPIPIIMNLSPDKKSGDMLSRWGKECFSTWASLFIRVAVISFAIYFIGEINKSGGIFSYIRGGNTINNLFVSIFVMFGILLFAKEFPKLLEDILGIKASGKLTLNPLKKLKTDMVGAGLIGGATAGLLGGGLGGAIRGAWNGKNAKDFSEGAKKAAEKNRSLREFRSADSNIIRRNLGKAGAKYSQMTGSRSASEKLENIQKDIDTKIKGIDDQIAPFKRRVEENKLLTDKVSSMEKRAIEKIQNGEAGIVSQQYLAMKANVENQNELMRQGKTTAEEVAKAEMTMSNYLNNQGMHDYTDFITSGGKKQASIVDIATGKKTGATMSLVKDDGKSITDAAMVSMFDDYSKIVKEHNYEYIDKNGNRVSVGFVPDADTRHSNTGAIIGDTNRVKRENLQSLEDKKRALEEQKHDAKRNEEAIRAKAYQDAAKK